MAKQTAFATPLWNACSDKTDKEFVKYIFFLNGYAYVTSADGYVMVKQDLTLSNIKGAKMLNKRTLHFNTFKAIMQHPTAIADLEGIETPDGTLHPYGDYEKRWPDFEVAINKYKETKQVSGAGVNVKSLALATELLGGSGRIKATYCGDDETMLMRVHAIEDVFAAQDFDEEIKQFALVTLFTTPA